METYIRHWPACPPLNVQNRAHNLLSAPHPSPPSSHKPGCRPVVTWQWTESSSLINHNPDFFLTPPWTDHLSWDFTLIGLHPTTFPQFQNHQSDPLHCDLPISHQTCLLPKNPLSVLCPQTSCDPITLLFKTITTVPHCSWDEKKMPQSSPAWSSPGWTWLGIGKYVCSIYHF